MFQHVSLWAFPFETIAVGHPCVYNDDVMVEGSYSWGESKGTQER